MTPLASPPPRPHRRRPRRRVLPDGSLPERPTCAPPGSEQKIQVMILRLARREALFHPDDGPAG